MPGLDPGIHEAAPQTKPYGPRSPAFIMDCRVKPGNDVEGLSARLIKPVYFFE
jgi:hypothetical protein